jgi:peroxiredoxin Q/BCP
MTQEQAPKQPEAGKKAPDFSMPTDGGGTISSKELKGKPYVIYFYPKDDTSGCTKEAIDFSAAKPEFDKIGCAIIGVSRDSVAAHGKFRAKHNLTVTLGADEQGSVTDAYGVWVEKSMYGRKYMGIERATFLVDGAGKIKKIWHKVKVPGHVAEVLAEAKSVIKS